VSAIPASGGRARAQWITPGLVIRVILSAGLLAAAFWLTSDKLDWRQLGNLNLPTLGACAALSLIIVWLLAWRWQRVTRAVAAGDAAIPKIGTFLRHSWLCLAVNQVLPTIFGGDALRVAMLSRQGVPLGGAVGSVLLDRIYGLAGLALLTVTSACLLAPSLAVPAAALATAVIAGIGIVALGWRFFADKLTAIIPVNGVTWRGSLFLVSAAILAHLANIGLFLVVATALGADLPILAATAVMCAVLLIGVLPVSVAGWGVREFALVQAFAHMGLPTDKVILASVIYGLVVFVMQAPGLLLLVGRNRP
jgi:uncharacterized membrane protein YbhN (UPF0104 family)